MAILEPDLKPQQDVSTLETVLVDICQTHLTGGTPLGLLIGGPKASKAVPASLPTWKPESLAGQRDHLRLANGRRPTVSCKQVQIDIWWDASAAFSFAQIARFQLAVIPKQMMFLQMRLQNHTAQILKRGAACRC